MGYVIAFGNCVVCGLLFEFNPDKVPSLRVNGQREPVCRGCMDTINKARKEHNLPEFPIMAGAYDEQECD